MRIFQMRNDFKGLVNQDYGVLHHGRPEQHDAEPLFEVKRRIAFISYPAKAETIQIINRQTLRLLPGHVFMILLNQRDIQVNFLVGNQGSVNGNRSRLLGMVRYKLFQRRLKRRLIRKQS